MIAVKTFYNEMSYQIITVLTMECVKIKKYLSFITRVSDLVYYKY